MLNKLANFIRNFRIDTNFTKFIVSFSLINLLFYSYPLIKYYYNHYHSLLLLFPVLIFVFLKIILKVQNNQFHLDHFYSKDKLQLPVANNSCQNL